MQNQGIKNVLFLSGGIPFPYIVSIGPETNPTIPPEETKKNKTTTSSSIAAASLPNYYEFGAGSLLACDEGLETKREAQKLILPEESIQVKEVIPLMVGAYHGLVTVSKHGRIKYAVYSSKNGDKKQWLEIKPVK